MSQSTEVLHFANTFMPKLYGMVKAFFEQNGVRAEFGRPPQYRDDFEVFLQDLRTRAAISMRSATFNGELEGLEVRLAQDNGDGFGNAATPEELQFSRQSDFVEFVRLTSGASIWSWDDRKELAEQGLPETIFRIMRRYNAGTLR